MRAMLYVVSRRKMFWASFTCLLASLISAPAVVSDTVLWYNGDPGYFGGEALNEQSTDFGKYSVFDDFSVSDSSGWHVTRLWAYDDLTITNVTQVSWSVRRGMAPGRAGTLVASGTSSATQTLLGESELQGFTKYRLEVSGLNFNLAAGQYWFSFVPLVGSDPGGGMKKSYLDRTVGINAVGTPAGDNGNALFMDTFGGVISLSGDYSMGIAGTVIPEPSVAALALVAVSLLAGRASGARGTRQGRQRSRPG